MFDIEMFILFLGCLAKYFTGFLFTAVIFSILSVYRKNTFSQLFDIFL